MPPKGVPVLSLRVLSRRRRLRVPVWNAGLHAVGPLHRI